MSCWHDVCISVTLSSQSKHLKFTNNFETFFERLGHTLHTYMSPTKMNLMFVFSNESQQWLRFLNWLHLPIQQVLTKQHTSPRIEDRRLRKQLLPHGYWGTQKLFWAIAANCRLFPLTVTAKKHYHHLYVSPHPTKKEIHQLKGLAKCKLSSVKPIKTLSW